MKLRILIIYMFLFYSCRRLPREFLFQKGIFFRGMTRVSKFFVTQCRFAKGSKGFGLFVKKCEAGQNVSLFFSYNDLFHEI